MYLNGGFVYGSTYTVAQATGSGSLILGAEPALSATYDSDVVWLNFLRFNRVLSENEIAAIGTNPQRLFREQAVQIWVPDAAAPASPTLTAASAINIGTTSATARVTFSR